MCFTRILEPTDFGAAVVVTASVVVLAIAAVSSFFDAAPHQSKSAVRFTVASTYY